MQCVSCAEMVRKTHDHPLVRTKRSVLLHFTTSLQTEVRRSADGNYGNMLFPPGTSIPYFAMVVFHKEDEEAERFKEQFKMLFTNLIHPVTFLCLEGGRLVGRLSTQKWEGIDISTGTAFCDVPRSFLNIFQSGAECSVCYESTDVLKDEMFMCTGCSTPVCHPCLSRVLIARGIDTIRADLHAHGYILMECPVCRRTKGLLTDRWDVPPAKVVKNGIGVDDASFRTLVQAIEQAGAV